jgi:hypothetical protein
MRPPAPTGDPFLCRPGQPHERKADPGDGAPPIVLEGSNLRSGNLAPELAFRTARFRVEGHGSSVVEQGTRLLIWTDEADRF